MKQIFNILFKPIINEFYKGSNSLLNLSSYVFGISGTLVTLGAIILPYKVLDILNASTVTFLGMNLGKNGLLGLISLITGLTASLIQPLAGFFSDKNIKSSYGQRIPFIFVGGIGVSFFSLLLVPVQSVLGLMIIFMIINIFGNLGEGPANALIKDHIESKNFGSASGVFNFSRVLGAAIVLLITLQFMKNYSGPQEAQWFWGSIIFISIIMLVSTIWSSLSLKTEKLNLIPQQINSKNIEKESTEWTKNQKKKFLWFIIAFSISVTSLSSLQTFAIYFVSDVVIQSNIAQTTTLIILVLCLTIGMIVIPAGYISDKIGKKPLLILASISGVIGPSLMIPFHTVIPVLIGCALIGTSVGLILSIFWAIVNDLVPKDFAGRTLGFTAIAFLIGSGLARSSGFLVDWLNLQNHNWGYYFLLLLSSFSFFISPLIVLNKSVEEDK
ncbi:MAG: hypothetical protein CL764_03640 [Chloroflexi bacterium]|nr:hypothetical protein [Chloroflexota bacterium]|tara:strand:+ start:13745 stop:15070 length:1326 start_codon:yes stop_codon:yes gene_type:complete